MSLRSTLNPGVYHGFDKKPPFFEGWYYKLVSADEKHKLAIIPGVILGQDKHAFIQVLDGVEGTTAYTKFPLADFRAEERRFAVQIGENRFDESHISLALDSPECQLTGEIHLGTLNPWPVTLFSPGIMGWFAWVPRMECYHGVLSFSHSLQGTLTLNGKVMDFSGFPVGLGLASKQPFCGRLGLYHRFCGCYPLDWACLPGLYCWFLAEWHTPSFRHLQRGKDRITTNI
jgi:tocopherol cyclase